LSSDGNVVQGNLCAGTSNFDNSFYGCPSRSEPCSQIACKRYVCTQGELGACVGASGDPITCGTGTQTRSAQKCTLIGEDGSFTEVAENLCTQLSNGQPGCNGQLTSTVCQLAPCQTYVCVRQETPCYASNGQPTNCGTATRTRVSACSDSAGNQVAEYNCAAVGGCIALNGRIESCDLPACGAVVVTAAPVAAVAATYTCTAQGTPTVCRSTSGATCGDGEGTHLVTYACLNAANTKVDAALCLSTSSCGTKRETCSLAAC